MRSRIGRRILAGYLAVSVLLAVLLAALAFASTWIAQLASQLDRANRAASQVLATLARSERWLFGLLLQAANPSLGSEEHQVAGRLLASQVVRLVQAPELAGAGLSQQLQALAARCEAAAGALPARRSGARHQLAAVLACQGDLRDLLEAVRERLEQHARAGAGRLQAVQRAAWLPGFLRDLARNSQRAQRLSEAVDVTLQFEAAFFRALSSALAHRLGLSGPPAANPARLLDRLADFPEASAVTVALRQAASRAELHLAAQEGPAALHVLAEDARQVLSHLEALRPLLDVERDRALAEVTLVNGSVVSFVQTFAAAAVVGLLGGFVVLLAVTRSMTGSLEALREAMERVRDGHLDVQADVGSRRDETAEMARVFNHMVVELRESRERLRAYQADLERLVAERTRALQEAQAQLVQAEKLSAVGQLVAAVAHELNNPLTSVLGYGQLLESDPELPDHLRAFAATVVREADRARQIICSLLTFARPQPAERDVVDLNEVVRTTLEVPRWDLQQVTVTSHLHPEPLWVRANALQLQQVFTNIVQNALQAMGGSGRLEVTTARVGEHAVVEFADTGPGIPPEHLPRVFDPFFTTKKPGEGTGLGLSISYGIVRDHGGTLRARNRPEGGACFTVELPLSDPPAPTA